MRRRLCSMLSGSCLCLLTLVHAAAAADALAPVDLDQVKAGGEIGRRIDITLHNNLMKIDIDKDFLRPFEVKNAPGGYIGLGKLIDSAVKLAVDTKEPAAIDLKRRLIDRVIALQEPDGYVGVFPPEKRIVSLWDIHEMGYIVCGLTADYRWFGERRSLAAARKLADYLMANWSKLPADWDRKTTIATHVSVTGIERTLLALGRATNDDRYARFCLETRKLAEWGGPGIVIGRRQGIEGHIYAYMARALAQAELYRQVPEQRLLKAAREGIEFMTCRNGMSISGGTGQWEIWTDDLDGRGELGETCATAYQIRVEESLLRLTGQAWYGDLIERTIYNALFGAQSPDGRRIRYYTPVEGPRQYHPTDTYCCPCNYRRIVAELPGMIYYRLGEGVVVNLYTASSATIKRDDGLSIGLRQQTDYPNSGRVRIGLELNRSASFPLALRMPLWAKQAKVAVNGAAVDQKPQPGLFLRIERAWKNGDEVSVDFDMPWRLVAGRQRQAGRAALMRGPVVYCLNPAQNAALAKQDGADLGRMVIQPKLLGTPVASTAVRPNGLACPTELLKSGYAFSGAGVKVLLTEMADPDSRATYFRLSDPAQAEPDELLGAAHR